MPFFQLILLQDFIRFRKCFFLFFFLVSLVLFSSPLAGKGEPTKKEDSWAFCQSGKELFYKLNLNWWVWGMREIISPLIFFFSPADLSIVNLEVSSSSWTLWDLKYAKLKRWAIPTPGLFRQENPSPIWLAQLIKNSEFRAFHTHPKINAGFIDFPVGYCHCLLIPRQFSCLLLSEFLLLIPLPEELLLCCFFGAVWASQFSPAEGQRGITQRPTCILRLSSRWDIKSNSLLSASWKCCIFLIFLECALYIF